MLVYPAGPTSPTSSSDAGATLEAQKSARKVNVVLLISYDLDGHERPSAYQDEEADRRGGKLISAPALLAMAGRNELLSREVG